MDSLKERVTDMVRDVIGPELKARAFRRSGRTFWRNSADVCQLATVSMDRWGSANASAVEVNLGVFWHHVEGMLENPSVGKLPPRECHCTFRIKLGSAASFPPKEPWPVTHSSDFTALGAAILSDLLVVGLPWLEFRSDLRQTTNLGRYARSDDAGGYVRPEIVLPTATVVFNVMLGKKREALADLTRFARNGYGEDAAKLRERLGLPDKVPSDGKRRQKRGPV